MFFLLLLHQDAYVLSHCGFGQVWPRSKVAQRANTSRSLAHRLRTYPFINPSSPISPSSTKSWQH